MMEARHYEKVQDGSVRCHLCPHECAIVDGRSGRCRIRKNTGGTLEAMTYGRVASAGMDPIEKKPLYHFHPGDAIFSVGSVGCNLHCKFCQNWQISQTDTGTSPMSPAETVEEAASQGSGGIAYTYNEPMIWHEHVMDTGARAHEKGLYNVLVTNGFVNPEPLEDYLQVVDAMNIDLKAFDDAFYAELCGGTIEPVKRTVVRASRSCHVEITTLIIPNRNDSEADLEAEAKWIASEVGDSVPVHLSAYSPRYELDESPTSDSTLLKAGEVFGRYLKYVYLGNTSLADGSDTVCRGCGSVVVGRRGYRVDLAGMRPDGTCASCGAENGIVAVGGKRLGDMGEAD